MHSIKSLAGCINVTGHLVANQKGMQLNGIKITIEWVMNQSSFYDLSFEERAGFQQITVTVDADMNGVSQKEIGDWLKETENRCPVTDNIKTDKNVSVALKES